MEGSAGRSEKASRTGAAGHASQRTGASGAVSAGSTKGMEIPLARLRRATSEPSEAEAGPEDARPDRPSAVKAMVALIICVATKKLPRKVAA